MTTEIIIFFIIFIALVAGVILYVRKNHKEKMLDEEKPFIADNPIDYAFRHFDDKL